MSSLQKLPWILKSLVVSFDMKKTKGEIVGQDYRLARFTTKVIHLFWPLAILEAIEILKGYWWPQQYGEISLYLTPTSAIGALIIVVGAYIRYRCYVVMGPMFTREVSLQKDHKLIKHGPYGIVRHPSYTGAILVGIGYTLWYFEPGSLLRESSGILKMLAIFLWAVTCVPIYPVIAWRVGQEDRLMKERFGGEWNEWAKSVPYKLVPYVF